MMDYSSKFRASFRVGLLDESYHQELFTTHEDKFLSKTEFFSSDLGLYAPYSPGLVGISPTLG
jgi:hypothetical protein